MHITNFVNQKKKKNEDTSLDKKCEIIHISRKIFYHYRNKDKNEKSQQIGQNEKGRNQKTIKWGLRIFFNECKELRNLKMAITTKWAKIKLITTQSNII